MTEQEFEEAVEMLRSKDPMTYEDGFHWLIGFADKYSDKLVALMRAELVPDQRAKLVEVIGHCSKESVIPVIAHELSHESREVRCWAWSQLAYFENDKANKIAQKYKQENPDEDWF